MLLFKTVPTTLHKKYSYTTISNDFVLRVEDTENGCNIALVTYCHTELYSDPSLSFGHIELTEEVDWEELTYNEGEVCGLTKPEVFWILCGLPLLILNAVMNKVDLL